MHSMSLPSIRIIVLTTLLLASSAGLAHAATPAQIHGDAADGTIDGRYTLAELQAADRAVSTEQREYFGWDDVYSHHVRELAVPGRRTDPSAPKGRSRTRRAASSTSSSPQPRPSGLARTTRGAVAPKQKSNDARAREPRTVAAPEYVDRRASTQTAPSRVPAAWLLAALPLLVLAVGAGRFVRGRRHRMPRTPPHPQ